MDETVTPRDLPVFAFKSAAGTRLVRAAGIREAMQHVVKSSGQEVSRLTFSELGRLAVKGPVEIEVAGEDSRDDAAV